MVISRFELEMSFPHDTSASAGVPASALVLGREVCVLENVEVVDFSAERQSLNLLV